MPTARGLRILFVLEYYPPHLGGVETLFGQLAEALASRGHRVSVLTTATANDAGREERNGVAVTRLAVPRRGDRYWFAARALLDVFRLARDADVIHTTTYTAALPAWLASQVCRTPAVLTVHEVFAEQWHRLPGMNPVLGWGYRAFERAVLALPFRRYVADSAFTRGRLVSRTRVRAERTSVIYPPLDYTFWDRARHTPRDVKAELGMDRGDGLYLYFGRPGVSKGVEYLIDAAAEVSRAAPRSRLLMLLSRAPDPQYKRVRARIEKLGLAGHITVRDPVPRAELPGYLLGADCVVVPSISEGFGYTAAESAALGCPVIATTGHSVEEIVGRSVTLIPPRDPGAIARAVVAAFGAPNPREPVPRGYTLAAHVAAAERQYELALAPRRPTASAPFREVNCAARP